jgi:hypothetical protein
VKTSIYAYLPRFAAADGSARRLCFAAPALGLLLAFGPAPAWADDQSQTAQEIRELKARLANLEKRLDTQAHDEAQTRRMVSAAPTKKGEELPPTCPEGKFCYKGLTITPGGFFALEGLYRQHNMESDIDTPFGSIPFPNNAVGNTNESRWSERQSRLSLMVQGKPDPATTLTGYGEFDFLGAAATANQNQSNSFQPRVRHLYAGYDESDWGLHVIAGQTWSLATLNNFSMDPQKTQVPAPIDAQYVAGFTWTRQPQLRVYETVGGMSFGASIENASSIIGGKLPSGVVATSLAGCSGTTAVNTAADSLFNACDTYTINRIPDMIGKVAWDGAAADHKIHLEGFGLLRDFYDRTIDTAAGVSPFGTGDHDTWGGGFGGGAIVEAVPKMLDLQFSGLAGNGVGRYGTSTLPDVTYNPVTGKFDTVSSYQMLAGATLHATPTLDFYAYGGEEVERAKYVAGAAYSAYGVGNPLGTNNTGCDVPDSLSFSTALTCNGNTRMVRELTVGLWDTVYKGNFGQVKVGAQYEYIQRQLFAAATPGEGGAPTASENVGMVSLRYYPF